MKNPLVSVLMPAYNTEKYIGQAIESILKQTYTNFEFIIIDDASNDNTLKIIQKYAKKDKRIIVLQNKINKNITECRNILVKRSKGKYIIWQDSDDVSCPSRVEKQVQFMEKNKKVGLCGSYIEIIDEKGNITGLRKYFTEDEKLRQFIFRFAPVANPAVIIRKECFNRVGLYDNKSLIEDTDLHFRLGRYYKFANLPEVLVQYRMYDKSNTFLNLKKIEIQTIQTRLKYAKFYKVSFFDILYNIVHFISIFIIPKSLKIKLFNKMRSNLPYEKKQN